MGRDRSFLEMFYNSYQNETITKFIGLHIKDDVKKLAMSAKKYTGIEPTRFRSRV